MILTTLHEADAYAALAPGIAAGLAWLRAFDPAAWEDGRHEIADGLHALVSTYDTHPATDTRFEAHRHHIDLQLVASGIERILVTPLEGLAVEVPYDEEGDITFYADPPASSSILVPAGALVILHPADAHKPGCMAAGRHPVRKAIVKVRI